MRIWRISEFADLSGEGGRLFPGRWNRREVPIVYCADHPSTSLLETIVHIDREDLPDSFQLLEIAISPDIKASNANLLANWQEDIDATQSYWDEFVGIGEYALLRVPSVIMPQAFNYLLNPTHPDAAKLTIAQIWRYPFDSRLLM